MEKVINVNLDILRRYSHSKDAKEILCFAIWCKMQHSNSIMYNLSIKELKTRLKVGYNKAKKLLEAIDNDGLFRRSDDGKTFSVISFRDKTKKWNKRGKTYSSAFVCKIDINKDYTLKELYNILNEKLFLLPIVVQEKNCLKNAEKKQTMRCQSSFITLREFEKVVGMSHGAVCKIKKTLVKKGVIKSTLAESHCADARDEKSKDGILKKFGRRGFTFAVGTLLYLIVPCSYSVAKGSELRSFQHKIYNYHNQAWSVYNSGLSMEERNPLFW